MLFIIQHSNFHYVNVILTYLVDLEGFPMAAISKFSNMVARSNISLGCRQILK